MKKHHHNDPVAHDPNSRSEIHEAIAARAYELWLERGKPENQADELWFQAERELKTEKLA
jgi:hypothetical protein